PHAGVSPARLEAGARDPQAVRPARAAAGALPELRGRARLPAEPRLPRRNGARGARRVPDALVACRYVPRTLAAVRRVDARGGAVWPAEGVRPVRPDLA